MYHTLLLSFQHFSVVERPSGVDRRTTLGPRWGKKQDIKEANNKKQHILGYEALGFMYICKRTRLQNLRTK